MRYKNVIEGVFLARPNRFIAQVEICGRTETVHVKNTGRCRELLLPGCKVVLAVADNPARKTKFDLVAVYKQGLGLVNMDSQAPNAVVKEWLAQQDYSLVRPEYTWGNSRFDFYLERGEEKYLLEVKGCTLEIDGVGYFPDAPSERAVKHLQELAHAAQEGCRAGLAYVIQMPGIKEVHPNTDTHPQYGEALKQAKAAGVKVFFLQTRPCPEGFEIIAPQRLEWE